MRRNWRYSRRRSPNNRTIDGPPGDARRLEGIDLAGLPLLIELIELLQEKPHLSTGALLEHWRDRPEGRHLAKLAGEELLVAADGLEDEFASMLMELEARGREAHIEALLAKENPTPEEKEELKQLLKR